MAGAVTANGRGVVRGQVQIPRVGVWHADLVVDARELAPFEPGTALRLVFEAAGDRLELVGTVRRAGKAFDAVALRVVAGAGGLSQQLEPKAYQGVPLRIPLVDVLRDAGERLALSSDAAALGLELSKWIRIRQSAGAALWSLLELVPDRTWRVLADGSVWIGRETWPPARGSYQLLALEPVAQRLELSAAVPQFMPGQTIAEGRVDNVLHLIDGGRLRSRVWLGGAA
jgi:hypothetical protein